MDSICAGPGRQAAPAWQISNVLAELEHAGDTDVVRELIEAFVQDSAARLEKIKRAAASGDLGVLAAACHALKGSALVMSADRVSQLTAGIEACAAAGEDADYPAMVRELERMLEQTRLAMISHQRALAR